MNTNQAQPNPSPTPSQSTLTPQPPPTTPTPPTPPPKKSKTIPILIGSSILIVLIIFVVVTGMITVTFPTNTSSWLTYSNETFGVSFKYPPEYPQPTYTDFITTCNQQRCLYVTPLTTTDFANRQDPDGPQVTNRPLHDNALVHQGVRAPSGGLEAYAYLQTNGRYFRLTLHQDQSEDDAVTAKALTDQLNGILESFTASSSPISPTNMRTPSESWLTYTDDYYHFSFTYPPNLEINTSRSLKPPQEIILDFYTQTDPPELIFMANTNLHSATAVVVSKVDGQNNPDPTYFQYTVSHQETRTLSGQSATVLTITPNNQNASPHQEAYIPLTDTVTLVINSDSLTSTDFNQLLNSFKLN